MSGEEDKASTERVRGSVKEAIGKLTGDARVEAEGKAQRKPLRDIPKSDGKPGTARRS